MQRFRISLVRASSRKKIIKMDNKKHLNNLEDYLIPSDISISEVQQEINIDPNINRQPAYFPKAPELLRIENIREGWIIELNSVSCDIAQLCFVAENIKDRLLNNQKKEGPSYVQ